jgi:hypothetical protein
MRRFAGLPKKVTTETNDVLKQVLLKERNLLETHLNSFQPKDRLELLTKLLPIILPKSDIILCQKIPKNTMK